MRTFVYVDGLNLFYGALRGTPWRWLDLYDCAVVISNDSHLAEAMRLSGWKEEPLQEGIAPRRSPAVSADGEVEWREGAWQRLHDIETLPEGPPHRLPTTSHATPLPSGSSSLPEAKTSRDNPFCTTPAANSGPP